MDCEELISLLSRAADGDDNLQKAVVGFAGYGFFFADPFKSDEIFVTVYESSKFAGAGANRGVAEKILQLEHIRSLGDLGPLEDKNDCLFAGSLKTLIPTLEFGGYEILFWVWMFIKTPDGKQFPATFYYGATGTALGGWMSYQDDDGKNVFPDDVNTIINFSPFDFSSEELEEFIEALELALRKVPVSDFYGVYHHDLGNDLMGVMSGIPFAIELGYEYDEVDIEIWLDAVEFYKDKFDEVYGDF